VSARDIPYADLAKQYGNRAAQLNAYMEDRRKAGMLSKSEELSITNEIEDLKQRASVGIARERDQRIAGEITAQAQYNVNDIRAGSIEGVLRGSIEQQSTGQIDISLKSVNAERDAIKEILSISRTLTREEQIRYNSQLKGLDAREKELRVMRDLATAQAAITKADLLASRATADATAAIIYGEGGRSVVEANLTYASAAASSMSARQAERRKLLAAGFAPDSKEVLELDSQIADLQNRRSQYARTAAVQPMSAAQEIGLSNLQTNLQLMKTGYGSFGEVRQNLSDQIGLLSGYLNDLENNRKAQQANGNWTPGMERDFTLTRNQYKMQMAQLANEYQNGWDQRLINEAYNMPGFGGQIFGAAFTHREASIAGVDHRAFGGTEQQTRGMREQTLNLDHMMTGNPRNMSRLVNMSGNGEPEPQRVEITLKIDQTPGFNLRATSTQVTNQRTSVNFNDNPFSGQTPGG
jgi:hypothetical protein